MAWPRPSSDSPPAPLAEGVRWAALDALRGWAILGVMAVHTGQWVRPADAGLAQAAWHGQYGVQLFFMISAFTLAHTVRGQPLADGHAVVAYAIRRWFRLAPLFYLAVLAYTLWPSAETSRWAPQGTPWWQLPAHLTFLHGWHPATINSLVPGGWSIAAEAGFYVLLPLLLWAMRRVRWLLALWGASLGLSLVFTLVALQMWGAAYPPGSATHFVLKGLVHYALPSQLPVFLLGLLAYQLWQRPNVLRQKRFWGAFGVLLGGLPLLAATTPLVAYHLFVSLGLLVGAVAVVRWPSPLFVNRWTLLLGRCSYSIYFLHFPVLALLASQWPAGPEGQPLWHYALAWGGVVVLSAAGATVTHRWIEQPTIALGRRLSAAYQQHFRPPRTAPSKRRG